MASGRKRQHQGRNRHADEARALEKLGAEIAKNPEAAAEIIQHTYSYSGPLPSPEMLQQYEDLQPGLADRIVTMAEKEQGNRHKVQQRILGIASRGQWFGLVLGLATLFTAAALIIGGYPVAGIVALVTGIGVIAGAFLVSVRRSSKGGSDRG